MEATYGAPILQMISFTVLGFLEIGYKSLENSNKFLHKVMVMHGALTLNMTSFTKRMISGFKFQGVSHMFLLVMMEIIYGAPILNMTSIIVQGHFHPGFVFLGR